MYNAESFCEALLLWTRRMVFKVSFGGAREATVWVRGFDRAIGLVEDLVRILDERFDLLDELRFVDRLVSCPLRLCELDML
jgi:hypothetical protein